MNELTFKQLKQFENCIEILAKHKDDKPLKAYISDNALLDRKSVV
jgi:hypothetical protein